FASGVASARKSSTPASAAIAAAVIGLSPVIIMVLIPIFRKSRKRSFTPFFTMSFKYITPSTLLFRTTTSGVPPAPATLLTIVSHSFGYVPPFADTYARTASAAPFRIVFP
ncbi:conserved hypothetical protein, partial [Listeria innocua FSL S4-378]